MVGCPECKNINIIYKFNINYLQCLYNYLINIWWRDFFLESNISNQISSFNCIDIWFVRHKRFQPRFRLRDLNKMILF